MAAAYSQSARALKIDTPLGEDKLLLRAFSGQEAISQLFRFQLDLLSEDDSIDFSAIIGRPVTLHAEIPDGDRCFHGHISRFSQGLQDGRFTSYRAEMVPWLWFLTRTADCRIFQNKKVPDIVQQIFRDLGFSDYKLKLQGSYRARDYCVQYRETDLNFVSRLMEEEGIYYYFQHEPGKDTLVLVDDISTLQPCPNQAKARCESSSGGWSPEDTISELRMEQEFRPSAWAHTDYNFEAPSASLMVQVQHEPNWEIYDYPGVYGKRDEGDKLAKARLEEANAFRQRATGKSNCRAFSTGYAIEVTGHYRSDMNQKWLLTAVYHQATMGGSYQSGTGEEAAHYGNTFECIPASTPFRPQRTTPKPHVQGCQSAVVTGPPGEEILTDKYGRVKVQFHWDREGKRDENSSCWIRVSQPWAGKDWGSVSIPRIGQEVLVDFLEGDPDQPVIIGRVYNAEQMPPYPLPAGAHNMGMKSKSIKGGGFNEFSISDVAGKEAVTIHAQYDMSTTVQHNDTQTIVSGDRAIDVKAGKHTEKIHGDTSITILQGNHSLAVNTGTLKEEVKGAVTEIYHDAQNTTVHNGIAITSETAHIYVHTATSIQLHVGDSKIWMDSGGQILLEGTNVTLVARDTLKMSGKKVETTGGESAKMGVGNQNVVCDKQKVATSGAAVNTSAVGMHEITGAVVKIN